MSFFNIFYIVFFAISLLVIVLAEKATFKAMHTLPILKKNLEDMQKQEKLLAEYYELSLLAMASKDKEAYKGFQEMMNEIYWRLFFRQLLTVSAVFFLILSPYMVASDILLSSVIVSPFTQVFMLAILYFTVKNVYNYIREVLELRRKAKELEN